MFNVKILAFLIFFIYLFFSSDCMVIISKICHLFKNYPELLQGFGMFLPPSVNLQVQTAGRFLVKGDKDEIFPLFIKTEDDYDPNRVISFIALLNVFIYFKF